MLGAAAALATGLKSAPAGAWLNPVAAAVLAALLVGEPITLDLIFGLIAVIAGIWLATSDAQQLRRLE